MNLRTVPEQLKAPFLAAKVQPPARATMLVARARLTERLHDGRSARITVISGPAGAGKTCLLSDWAASPEAGPAGWLTLDSSDNDPPQFWTGVLGALASVCGPEFTVETSRLVGLIRSDQRRFLSALGDALEQIPDRVSLVLDDLHEIVNDEIYDGLSLVAEHLHPHLRLIVSTRTAPPLGLARLRARGQLCEIRFEDLRFNTEESRRLLEQMFDSSVAERTAASVQRHTDGWAAALYVAAIGIEASDASQDPERYLDSVGQDRHLSDYLVEEVLSREPPEHRKFMLETSILDRLDTDRCNGLTGRSDAAQMLSLLEASSQFVYRVGGEGRWFAYHDLLRQLLRDQLRLEGVERWQELHRRAAAVARSAGDWADAVHHHLEAGDLDEAAIAIGEAWIDFTNRGLFATVMTWLDRWQEAERGRTTEPADPTIFIIGAWMALHTGRLQEVERWLARAEGHSHAGPLPDGTSSLQAAVAIVRCSHYRRIGDVDRSLSAGREAVELEIDETGRWRSVACIGYGNALFWAGDEAGAREMLDEARRIAIATSLSVPVLLADGYQALMERAGGNGERALAIASAAVAMADAGDFGGYDQAAPAYLAVGLCAVDAVDLETADAHLQTALGLARQGDERLLEAEVRFGLMALADLRGRSEDAAVQLEHARRIAAECAAPGQLLTDRLASADHRPAAQSALAAPHQRLTERELTVLRYLQSDLTFPQIAAELFVSANTVKTHVSSIRTKLSARDRREAVRKARQTGLLG